MTSIALAHPPDLGERTLARELTHRINNQLAFAIDVVAAAAVRTIWRRTHAVPSPPCRRAAIANLTRCAIFPCSAMGRAGRTS